MDESSKNIVGVINEFVFNTIMGHESGFYKMTMMGKMLTKEDLKKDEKMHGMIAFAIVSYLNDAYRSLILKNDPYFLEHFNNMAKHKNHSMICLLNIVFVVLQTIHMNFDRSKLDITSLESYKASVMSQLIQRKTEITPKLIDMMSHECKGIDIKTCDPNEPMFHLGTKDE